MNQSPHRIHALELGPMENFIYLIEDCASKTAAVVDPAWDTEAIFALAKQHGLTITDVLLTHSHHDHINGVGDIINTTDAQLHLSQAEAKFWQPKDFELTTHHGGDTLTLGKTEIHLMHTPGHTPGSACYQIGEQVLTGDTMFVFGCGRCDLPGGDPNTMYQTLKRIKEHLPKNTVIRPGHNYAHQEHCTLSEQLQGNPFYHMHSAEDFVEFRMHRHGKVRDMPFNPVNEEIAQCWLHQDDCGHDH